MKREKYEPVLKKYFLFYKMGGRRDCDWNCERKCIGTAFKIRPMGVGILSEPPVDGLSARRSAVFF